MTTGKKGIFNMRGCFGDEPECDYDVCDERDTCPFFLDGIRKREIENDQIAHITEEEKKLFKKERMLYTRRLKKEGLLDA